jgi:hypothetical protein
MDTVLKLLQFYHFDLGDRSLTSISIKWGNYNPYWLRSAITESIYRGRYKVISVEQILESWQRNQQISCKFDLDFECLVWNNFAFNPPQPNYTQLRNNSDADNLSDNTKDSAIVKKLKSLCQV